MSRVGKRLIEIPSDVNISIDNNKVAVKGKLGELSQEVEDCIKLNLEGNKLALTPASRINSREVDFGKYSTFLMK